MKLFQKYSSLKKSKDMDRIETLWQKSRSAEERGNLMRAIEIQKRIVSNESPTYASIFRLASLYYRNQNYNHALDCYQKAWDISESMNWPLEGMRNCYQAMGNAAEALQINRRLQGVTEQRLAS